MPISNVALTNTFNEWRVRTNEVIVAMNDVLNDGLVTYRNITANVFTANSLVLTSGANVVAVLNASFEKANSGVRTGWTTLVANNPTSQVTITPASNNDTLTLRTTGNVSITGVSANDNVIFDLTDTTVAAGSYGSSSAVPVITVDSKGRLTTVTTATIDTGSIGVAFDKANAANVLACTAFDKANTANVIASLAFDKANTANVTAFHGFAFANTVYSSVVLKTGNTMTGSLVMSSAPIIMNNNILSRPRINNYSITAYTIGNATGSVTVDLLNGHYFTATTTGSTTWTFSNPAVTGNASGFILVLTNGGSASQLWPPAVDWQNGTAPTLTAAGVDVLAFITNDGGTIWRGVLSVKDSK